MFNIRNVEEKKGKVESGTEASYNVVMVTYALESLNSMYVIGLHQKKGKNESITTHDYYKVISYGNECRF